jgi:hypothetical protein
VAVVAVVMGGWFVTRREAVAVAPPAAQLVDVPAQVSEAEAVSEYRVESDPPGAALWVDGEFHGNAPGVLRVPRGVAVKVRLELPAHRPIELDLRADGAPHPFFLPLTALRPTGRVRFAIEDDERLWVDGVLVAQGLVVLPLEGGSPHRYSRERGGQLSAEQAVVVAPGAFIDAETRRPLRSSQRRSSSQRRRPQGLRSASQRRRPQGLRSQP